MGRTIKQMDNFAGRVDDLFKDVNKTMEDYGEVVGKIGDSMTGDVILDGPDVQILGNLKGKTINEIKTQQEMIINWIESIAKAVNDLSSRLEQIEQSKEGEITL